MLFRRFRVSIAAAFAAALFTGCGGGSDLPSGSVVNSPGGSGPPPTKLVKVKVTVTIPHGNGGQMRPDYVSRNTQSLSIQLVSVDGKGVTGVNTTTVNTIAHAHGCKVGVSSTICTASTMGSPGTDVFSVTTYASTNANGAVLSVGTVKAKIAGDNGNVAISNTLSLMLDGVISTIKLGLAPAWAKRGTPTKSTVSLAAYDASGAQIVGPSDFLAPVQLTIQGDARNAFALHSGKNSGTSLTIVKPTSDLTMTYDGDTQASPVTVQASVDAPSISAHADFALRGKQPPPPVGTIYALNLGTNDGQSATVTEYDGTANGNSAPERTLQLSSKLYARGIAVDSSGNLYVGYFDNEFGFSPSDGTPDAGNEIAIYSPNASGNQGPTKVLTSDRKTQSRLFPLFMSFDPKGDLVTYGSTSIDSNAGGDAVLTYAPQSSGPAVPISGFNFASPRIDYAGPTGLVLDASGNFYVNGALHTSLGPDYGLYVASASDADNPSAAPARTIPWDNVTQLSPGLTTNVSLDDSGEIFIGNVVLQGSGSSASCQGRTNVFAAGASGNTTDVPPLRTLTLEGVFTSNPLCASPRYSLSPFFPSITIYGASLFVADDFNSAIDVFSANAHGSVRPSLQINGPATELNAPIALVITSVSGRAKARPAHPQ